MHVSSVSHPRMYPRTHLGICLKQRRAHTCLHEYLCFRGEKKSKLHVCCLLYRNVARTLHRRFCLPRVSPALCICRGHIWLLLPPFASPAASSFAVSLRLCFNHPTERERDVRQDGNAEPSVPVKFRGRPVRCGANAARSPAARGSSGRLSAFVREPAETILFAVRSRDDLRYLISGSRVPERGLFLPSL